MSVNIRPVTSERPMEPSEVPFPETPAIAEATVVQHPQTGRDCLLVTTEDGRKLAFGFEVESDTPGIEIVDPRLWLAAAEEGAPERSSLRFEAVEDARADDWLQALVSHPDAAEWLSGIKREYPDAYHKWFAQVDYETGGEEGSG